LHFGAKNKSANDSTKWTCPNYQFAQFYLFIFLMTRLLITKDLSARRVWFFVLILSAHLIALLYCFIVHFQRRDIWTEIPDAWRKFFMVQPSAFAMERESSANENLKARRELQNPKAKSNPSTNMRGALRRAKPKLLARRVFVLIFPK